MPKSIIEQLEIKPVRWIDDVLEVALQHMPTPLEDDAAAEASAQGKSKKTDALRPHQYPRYLILKSEAYASLFYLFLG